MNLPTRLIDVGLEGSTPRLFATHAGQTGAYTALSYCWGIDPGVKLDSSNEADLQNSIPLGMLPSTVRDALLLTRRLGIQYIWVDCLCIMQGKDDLARQDWGKYSPLFHIRRLNDTGWASF